MTTSSEPAVARTVDAAQTAPSTEECISALVDVLPRIVRVFKSQLRGGKLTNQHMFLLMTIRELSHQHEDGAQPGELARRACLSSAAITAALDDLVDEGYCVRAHSEKDRRKVLVHLTPYGDDMLREARAGAVAAMHGMLSSWDQERRARLFAVLQDLDAVADDFMCVAPRSD